MCTECFGNGFVGRAVSTKWGGDGLVMVSRSAPCPNCCPKEYKQWLYSSNQPTKQEAKP